MTYLRNHAKKAFRAKELARNLNVTDQKAFHVFMSVLLEMAEKGEVQTVKGPKYQYAKPKPTALSGALTVHPQGYGFVKVEGFEDDFYIPQGMSDEALDGDVVQISPFAKGKRSSTRRQEAQVTAILERKRTQIVGTFMEDEDGLCYVRPDDPRIICDLLVQPKQRGKAQEGDKVVISRDRFNRHLGVPEGRITEVLGRSDDPSVQILALAMARDVKAAFPPEVIQQAERIPNDPTEAEIARRLDLRTKRVFTIDPADAKDFDDALHLERLPNGNIEVGVHIADVSAYVTAGSALDREAYERATSVYLVDRVMPMLPEKLSNGVCSLRPNEDKLAFSVLFEVNAQAQIQHYDVRETVIRSQQRFAYEDAQVILDDPAQDHPFAEDVRLAWTLAQQLRKFRFDHGSVRFDRPEVKVRLDATLKPVEVYAKVTREANWLIEEWMLLANQTVARHAQKHDPVPPFIYRTHDAPNAEKMTQLSEYIKIFGLKLAVHKGRVSPQDLNVLMNSIKGKPHALLIEDAALRAMAKAKYTVENIGHYGLGFADYTHFTSPIRRYPDLMVHRLLKQYAQSPLVPTDADALHAACHHCSLKEKEAEEAERDSIRLKQVEYMEQHKGDVFEGVISGVTNFGLFVTLSDVLVEGLIPIRSLGDDYYEYDEKHYVLYGKRSKSSFRIGDAIQVKVAQVDVQGRKLDFEPVRGQKPDAKRS